MGRAWFGKKKENEPGTGGEPAQAESQGSFQPNPAAARKFFDRAKVIHEASNFEYAMVLWLQGLRLDPGNTEALQNFLASGSSFASGPARPKGPTKDQIAEVGGSSPVDRFLKALLYWGVTQLDWAAGLRALEAAVKLGLRDAARLIGKRVLGVAGEDPKAKKDAFVSLMNLFTQVENFEDAVVAGEIACRKDPTDGRLAGEVKNLSAQSTMKKSGYEQGSTVEAGAFRRNVKDIAGQRAKEEEERIVKTEEVQERAIASARADYDSRPTDVGAVQKLTRLLLERGALEDEKLAYHILLRAYEATKNYRFKQQAGDVNLRVARRQVRAIREDAKANPDNAEKQKLADQAERQLSLIEIKEFEERVANNPTDLALRYELGKRYLELNQHEKAIEQLQLARESPGMLTPVLWGLGIAFSKLGWLDEAEASFREAITSHPVQTDETAAELRYGLMEVLERRAVESRDLAQAEEAFRLAAGIAMQRINFRDIRLRRQSLQDLVKAIKDGKAG
ncbi:MAG: tetratricopeptide repeat protein [Planctomycetota bacterium]|nr:tetratricopeptide repeat protein [Planctomycetota bacterium]